VIAFPQLAARVPKFLQNRRRDVSAIRSALTRGDFATVDRLGHSMKGSGASFGFQRIGDLGAALEHAARTADHDASRNHVNALSALLDGLVVEEADAGGLGDEGPQASRGVAMYDEASSSGQLDLVALKTAGPLRIVLVEDDDDLRELVADVLVERGHSVRQAADGQAGLALILAERPDLALVDIGLSGIDGYEIARRVRIALGRSVRLVAMTGNTQEAERLAEQAAGFEARLGKPLDLDRVERMFGAVRPAS
jgi:CheY-like chemotaxis protein